MNGETERAGSGATPVISLEDVSKRYGAVVAIERAHFDVRRGELFSLLGPSGCGKTTLLRLIAGFEDVSGGRIRLDGSDVSRVPPYRRNVNTVFQHYALFPHLTVFDNVAFGPCSKGLAAAEVRSRVELMLEVVRLADLAARRPHQLSGGQRQRVALARALVNYPSALLLDEPLGALDLKLRQAMQIELKRIQREVGITFLFVTHDQDEAMAMSDRIAVMNRGRIEQVGSPQDVYNAPSTVFVAGFIGAANLLACTVAEARAGCVQVRLAGGGSVALTAAPPSLAVGQRVVVMIRPERIVLGRAEPSGDGPRLRATLAQVAFQGPVIRCVLRDSNGLELVAHVRSEQQAHGLECGASLWVGWAADACRLLPSDETQPEGDS